MYPNPTNFPKLTFMPRDFPERGYKYPVIKRDPQPECDHGNDYERSRRDLEVRPEVAVCFQGLRHGERELLGQGCEADDTRGPNGDHFHYALHFFYLLDATQPPWIGRGPIWV